MFAFELKVFGFGEKIMTRILVLGALFHLRIKLEKLYGCFVPEQFVWEKSPLQFSDPLVPIMWKSHFLESKMKVLTLTRDDRAPSRDRWTTLAKWHQFSRWFTLTITLFWRRGKMSKVWFTPTDSRTTPATMFPRLLANDEWSCL